MYTFIKILKNFDNRISESEMIESQYFSREYYQSENFHLNNFAKIIINKINDSSNLIKNLNIIVNEIKDEILNQINSNFSNHLILISKLQTVDFLIENIERPFNLIKTTIQNKLDILNKNENEIIGIIDYFEKNEKLLQYLKTYFTYFKLFSQAKILDKSIIQKEESTIFKYILENNEHITMLVTYVFLKKYLIKVQRLFTLNNKIERIINALKINIAIKEKNSDILMCENIHLKFFPEKSVNFNTEISSDKSIEVLKINRAQEDVRFLFVEKILSRCMNEVVEKVSSNKNEEIQMYRTIIKLLNDC